jgi:FKBP-type peptidyl-prolyl cis-trans isomerase FkpA
MPDFYRTTSKMQVAVGIILASFLMACKPPVQELTESQPDLVSEELVKANQYMQQRHQDHMAAFVERVGWKAEVTPTGLWIIHDIQGNGSPIVENSRVTFSFESTLLDGSPCYMASANKPKVVTIGKGGAESGVEQGMTWLREGSEAVFLIPPHLGHGNFGDRDRIPGNSVLIYRLKVMKVE